MSPKLGQKSNVRIERNIENESCSTIWGDQKSVYEPYANPKNSQLGPQRLKNDLKIKSKLNIRIWGYIENERFLTTWVDPKTVVKTYSDHPD